VQLFFRAALGDSLYNSLTRHQATTAAQTAPELSRTLGEHSKVVTTMNIHSSKALALSLGALLASCASGPQPQAATVMVGSSQLASAQYNPTESGQYSITANTTPHDLCALVPEVEQTRCPLQHTPVIGSRELVKRIDAKGYGKGLPPPAAFAPAGAVVYTLAAPGLTAEWLGHLVECYQARTEANALQAREACPLAESGASYSISSTRDGFAVAIRSSNTETAKRIFDVSKRLSPNDSPQLVALAVRP
jgi:hypothetical protein